MAQCVAYGFYLHQKLSNMVLGFFPPYVYSAIPCKLNECSSGIKTLLLSLFFLFLFSLPLLKWVTIYYNERQT